MQLRVRKMDFGFKDADVPRWWFHDNPSITHFANGLNLLFPPGERFFIRSVKHYLDDIEDPELKKRVKAFFGQEGRHGHEHERFNDILRGQGYDIDRFLGIYEKVAYGMLEQRFPANLRLATTVACEHFTATLAKRALTNPFIEGAHPLMQQLLKWHAAEEIEHKAVAFDVLQAVDPRYWVRIAGLAIATSQLLGWWMVGAAMLMAQEDLSEEQKRAFAAEAEGVRVRAQAEERVQLFKDAIVEYLRPDFHPNDVDDYHLARDYLKSVGAPL